MIAKKTTYAMTGLTVKDLEGAIATIRTDGAADDAAIHFFPNGDSYTLKAEWEVVEPDHAEPAGDERPAPVQAV